MLEVRSELNRIDEERKQLQRSTFDKDKELKKAVEKLAGLKKDLAKQKCEEDIVKLRAELAALQPGDDGVNAAAAPFLPGYMLLIDEPETAMHPSAIRAAKDHLYSLAAESGWQVMLSTHHPVFVDPLKDHTTIVRLHRDELNAAPNVFRAGEIAFEGDEKENLKSLLAFDSSIAEMFFGPRVVVMEGDTEFAAFTEVMNGDVEAFPMDGRPLLLRARGKATIPILVKMLTHFRVDFAVLHDIDSPRTTGGEKRNSAYSINNSIKLAVDAARAAGLRVIHRCSCPNFEHHHGMALPDKDKPYETWRAVRGTPAVKASVRQVLDELCAPATVESGAHADDGGGYETKLKQWVAVHRVGHPAFAFDQ
jgi:hypothetical protein